MSPPELQESSFPGRREALPPFKSNPERGATESAEVGIRKATRSGELNVAYGMEPDSRGAGETVQTGVQTAPPHSTLAQGGSTHSPIPSTTSPKVPQLSSPSSRSPSNFPSSSSPKISLDLAQTLDSTPPRQSSLRQPAGTPNSSTLKESTRWSPASSRTNSLRRKPPPRLDFSPDNSPRSQTQIDRAESPSRLNTQSQSHQQSQLVPGTPNREEEQKDTLSSLPSASDSPSINLSIPSSNLQFGSSADYRTAADFDRDDDTIGSGISYLSSSTSSSRDIEADDQPRPYQPSSLLSSSTTGFEHGNSARPYQGVGLGLPFSVSAAANLSSLASRAPLSSSHPLPIDIPSPSSIANYPRDPYRSPRPREERPGESPVVDRGQLIGLGELATPRWTSAALERRWGVPAEQGTNADMFDVHDPMVSFD